MANHVETVISLAPNLFYGTTIAVTILVLAKNKKDTKTQFIDASGEAFFKKATNTNEMEDRHIDRVLDIFASKADEDHVALSVENDAIAAKDYNLSVSTYVEPEDTYEVVDIKELNREIEATVGKIDALRAQITDVIAEIEA